MKRRSQGAKSGGTASRAAPMTRRQFVAGAAAAGLFSGLPTAHAAESGPMVVVIPGEPSTLDWQVACDLNLHEVGRNIFDTLLMRDHKTLAFKGNLAESWRLVNATTWQFKLRRGVKFHNGEPFDAAAVKFSVERMLDPKLGSSHRGLISDIDHVDVVDVYTANVVTQKPFPLLPNRMSSGVCGTISMVPPKYISQVGDAAFATKPVGTGPFKFVEWVKDDHVTVEANADYFLGRPAIDRVIFRIVPELSTRVAALVSGQADLVLYLPPDQVGKVNASAAAKAVVSHVGGFVIMTVITNYLMPGPWEDVRVRRAINHAIDMDTIIKTVLGGYADPVGLPLERGAFAFDQSIKMPGYDPERAKALLKEAGHGSGFSMTLNAPNHRYMNDVEVMQAIASMLGNVGIQANVQVTEQSVYVTKWAKRQLLPDYMVAWGGGGLFDADLLFNSLDSHSALSIYKNPALDTLLEQARTTIDAGKRKNLYYQAQQLVAREVPLIKAYQQATIFGVSNRLAWEPWIDGMIFLRDARFK
jgi:peptide/nickel transport system substrate-binding protein